LQFLGCRQHIDLELYLVEQLAIAICILHKNEGLLMVHLMFLDLLNLVFLALVEDVTSELVLVLLQHLDVVHAVVEVGGHEFVEIGKVHELGVD